MRLKAIRDGTWPDGFHWSTGKERDVNLPDGADVPPWLVEVKAPKAKKAKKAKADEPVDAPDAG